MPTDVVRYTTSNQQILLLIRIGINIVRFLKTMSTLPIGDELEKRCRDLGVDTTGEPRTQSVSGSRPRASDFELQRRLLEAERSARESKLWVVALVSAVASVVSAVAAWVAVVMVGK